MFEWHPIHLNTHPFHYLLVLQSKLKPKLPDCWAIRLRIHFRRIHSCTCPQVDVIFLQVRIAVLAVCKLVGWDLVSYDVCTLVALFHVRSVPDIRCIVNRRFLFMNLMIAGSVVRVQRKNHWWMDDLRFYVLFNSNSVISWRCEVDNERLCAKKLRLRLRRFRLERGSNSGPLDQ